MKNVEKYPRTVLQMHLDIVAVMWADHHPRGIADYINTKCGYWGSDRVNEQAIWNYHQQLAQLDRRVATRR